VDRKRFDALEILEQINYINKILTTGESLRSISDSLGISKTTIRDRFKKLGYVFNADIKQYHKNNTKASQGDDKQELKPIDKGDTNILQMHYPEELNDLKELLDHKDDILEMLKDYKSNARIIEVPQLDINTIPHELCGKISNKSIKVYEAVHKLFDEVCNQYGNIKKQDLVSISLYEFYIKYKK
jgi:predicted DNA-binding protein YlxM (UPF0122 family)